MSRSSTQTDGFTAWGSPTFSTSAELKYRHDDTTIDETVDMSRLETRQNPCLQKKNRESYKFISSSRMLKHSEYF